MQKTQKCRTLRTQKLKTGVSPAEIAKAEGLEEILEIQFLKLNLLPKAPEILGRHVAGHSAVFHSMGTDASAEDSELRTQSSELWTQTQNSELRTQDSGLRIQDSELRTQNSGLRTHNSDTSRFSMWEGFYVTCNVRDADQDGGAAASSNVSIAGLMCL